MHRFIFTSDATTPLSAQQLADIAGVNHRNNRRAGISGLLIMHQGKFFYVMEGEESHIRRVCAQIQNDPRHSNFEAIELLEVQERAFMDFSIVHETPERLPFLGNETVLPLAALLPTNSKARGALPNVRRAVRDFLASFSVLVAA